MPSSTRRGIFKSILSTGKPTATTRAPAFTTSIAWLNGVFATAVITVASSPLPPVNSFAFSTGSSFNEFTVASAPSSFAKANFSSLISNATTLAPNTFLAYCTAKFPKPPIPNTPIH